MRCGAQQHRRRCIEAAFGEVAPEGLRIDPPGTGRVDASAQLGVGVKPQPTRQRFDAMRGFDFGSGLSKSGL